MPLIFSWCCRTAIHISLLNSLHSCNIWYPNTECCFITANSSSVSLAGLLSIEAGTLVFPISCRSPDTPSSYICLSGRHCCLPIIIAIVATSTLCLKVYSSLVLSVLISIAIALLALIASIRLEAMLSAVSESFSDSVLAYMY